MRLTRGQAVRAYARLRKELGRRPIMQEYLQRCHKRIHLIRLFGPREWTRLRIAAGDPPTSARDVTKAQLIRCYRGLRTNLGRQPTLKEYAASCYGYGIISAHFHSGAWLRLQSAAGDKPRIGRKVSKKELVKAYRRLREDLGRQPLSKEYYQQCHGVHRVAARYGDGSWRQLVIAAGDQPLNRRNISRQDLIDAFLALQKKLGRRPTLPEYTAQCHTPKVLDRVFGRPGWRGMITALGVKAMPGRLVTPEQLIRNYLETWAALGWEPNQRAFWLRHRHKAGTIERYFGTPHWENFRKAVRAYRRGNPSPG